MINKERLAKMLRDLRVLDFLNQHLNFSMDSGTTLYIYKYSFEDCEYQTIELDIPDYIKNDLYEWMVDDEI